MSIGIHMDDDVYDDRFSYSNNDEETIKLKKRIASLVKELARLKKANIHLELELKKKNS